MTPKTPHGCLCYSGEGKAVDNLVARYSYMHKPDLCIYWQGWMDMGGINLLLDQPAAWALSSQAICAMTPPPSIYQGLSPTLCRPSIYVSHEDSSSQMKAVQEIRRRAQSRGEWPKVLIFPEGTTTHTQQAVFLELAVLADQLCERLLLASNWETMPLFLAWALLQ